MFEANCSRQMGQHKKKTFHKMFLCLHGGLTKVRVSDADRNCLAECKVEGDRTDAVLNAMCYW